MDYQVLNNEYTIKGDVFPSFEPVKNAFENNFKIGVECSSQLCIYIDGLCIIDLYGKVNGNKTPGGKQVDDNSINIMKQIKNYNHDSIQQVFSCSKNFEAIAMCICVERGLIDYNDKICKYWEEFSKNGKENITLKDVLMHDSGLSRFKRMVTVEDIRDQKPGGLMSKLIEDSQQIYNLFSDTELIEINDEIKRNYHSSTRGFIIQQILQRIDPKQRTIGQFINEELCKFLEIENSLYLGIPIEIQRSDKVHIAPMVSSVEENSQVEKTLDILKIPISELSRIPWALDDPDSEEYKKIVNSLNKDNAMSLALTQIFNIDCGLMNSEVSREIEVPSGNVHTNARTLAKIGSVMANNGKFLNKQFIKEETINKSYNNILSRFDNILLSQTLFTQGGFGVFRTTETDINTPEGFGNILCGVDCKDIDTVFYGWGGAGGSVFIWCPEFRISFAYTMTGMASNICGGPRTKRILNSLFECLA